MTPQMLDRPATDNPIDLAVEEPIRLGSARNLPHFKRDGKRPDLATVCRWSTVGILRDGQRIRLQTVQIGGSRCTTREAVERFIAALSSRIEGEPTVRTPGRRERAIQAAEAETSEI